MRALPAKVHLLTAVVILSNLVGNTLLSHGMHGTSGIDAFLRPATIAGIGLLIFWTLIRATLLSWADLSYVLPVTALGYVLTAITGAVFLGEKVSALRWTATLLIVAGIVLAGTTSPKTTPSRPPE
jgi:drug/metabolite transporter (DMT)-like permease